MKNILITGGSGLFGRYLVRRLKRDYWIHVVDKKPPREDVEYTCADVLDLSQMTDVTRGVDAIIHLAAIPHPLDHPAEEVFRVNVMGTFNVLEAAALNSVRTCVLASSESTLGFAFAERRSSPEYLPVDEHHPLRPQDPYGMSKVVGEEMCRAYTRRCGIQTLCMRMPWIWVPEPNEQRIYRNLIEEYPKWYKNLWAFIHVTDAAEAFALALNRPYREEHEVWFITADHNWVGLPSIDLARQFFPEARIREDKLQGTASLIAHTRACDEIGFRPRFGVADVFADSEKI